MTASRSPGRRPQGGGSRRITPKGTRPGGVAGRATGAAARAAIDRRLVTEPPKGWHGRTPAPASLRQRSGHRGGR